MYQNDEKDLQMMTLVLFFLRSERQIHKIWLFNHPFLYTDLRPPNSTSPISLQFAASKRAGAHYVMPIDCVLKCAMPCITRAMNIMQYALPLVVRELHSLGIGKAAVTPLAQKCAMDLEIDSYCK